jgi:hypothetical protein
MLSIELMGGIGNQMFQIATIEVMAQEIGTDVYYADIDNFIEMLSRQTAWTTHAREYLTIFKNLDLRKNQDWAVPPKRIVRVPFEYRRIIAEDDTRYVGYFQSESYFAHYRDFVLKSLEPSDDISARLSKYDDLLKGTTCSIHVRRGNYVQLAHIHPPCDMDYYNRAMEYLRPYGIERYIVVSDDMTWCRENFIGEKFVFVEDTDYICLFLQSRCTHHIIANSSFSWWAAWIGQNVDKRTIAPERWFGDDNNRAKDIVPWHWIKV